MQHSLDSISPTLCQRTAPLSLWWCLAACQPHVSPPPPSPCAPPRCCAPLNRVGCMIKPVMPHLSPRGADLGSAASQVCLAISALVHSPPCISCGLSYHIFLTVLTRKAGDPPLAVSAPCCCGSRCNLGSPLALGWSWTALDLAPCL